MDDPWANAWHNEQQDHTKDTKSSTNDAEADIALPSWSTGAAVRWAEPSADQSTLWGHSEATSTGWTSTYDGISFGQSLSAPFSAPATPPPRQIEEEPSTSSPEDPRASIEPTVKHTVEPQPRSVLETPSPPSPDVFGTFETGVDASEPDVDPWAARPTVPHLSGKTDDDWSSSSWGESGNIQEEKAANQPIDEWEKARIQKARQDEHVPPEVLSSILDDFLSFSSEFWPVQSPSGDPSRAQDGLESVDGLNAIANKLIPHDLTLSPHVQFSKTFTAKHMGESIRLSRHVSIARLSPFAMYIASKGSTSWEVSVKSHVDVSNDDLLPAGWRVVEKEREKEQLGTITEAKRSNGGLLSFFGRKTTSPLPESNPRRSESPKRAPSITTILPLSNSEHVPSPQASSSPRPSLDGTKSPVRSSTPIRTSSSLVSDFTTSAPSPKANDNFDPEVQSHPAPSVVSRFLGRFSRNRTSVSGTKESLVLSTDDVDFLSDIVPSASDDFDEGDQLQGLKNLLSSPPISTPLPPPLAPPPRAPPTNHVPAANPQVPLVNSDDDLFSLFDSPSTANRPTPVAAPTQPSFSTFPAASTLTAVSPLPRPSSHHSQSSGVPSSSSRLGGGSSPFDISAPPSRSQTPSATKRGPIAIMSTGSSSSSASRTAGLPPPPMLPPPPPFNLTRARSHSRVSSHLNIFENDISNPAPARASVPQQPLLFDTSSTTTLPDQTFISKGASTSDTKSNGDFFDDFDDFVSSTSYDPSPPRPQVSSVTHSPIVAPQSQSLLSKQSTSQPLTQPPPPPRKSSRAADHQRTLSLVTLAANRTGRWPAPPSPLPEPLQPPPSGATQAKASVDTSHNNGPALSVTPSFPFPPPPPGLPSLPATFAAPQQRTGSALPVPANSTVSSGGLSAQDLSFFEGL